MSGSNRTWSVEDIDALTDGKVRQLALNKDQRRGMDDHVCKRLSDRMQAVIESEVVKLRGADRHKYAAVLEAAGLEIPGWLAELGVIPPRKH